MQGKRFSSMKPEIKDKRRCHFCQTPAESWREVTDTKHHGWFSPRYLRLDRCIDCGRWICPECSIPLAVEWFNEDRYIDIHLCLECDMARSPRIQNLINLLTEKHKKEAELAEVVKQIEDIA